MSDTSRREVIKLSTAAAGAAAFGATILSSSAAIAQGPAAAPSFESINSSIDRLKLPDNAAAMALSRDEVAAIPAGVQQKICGIYTAIRPLLLALSTVVFIPPSWRAALKTFITVLDPICGL